MKKFTAILMMAVSAVCMGQSLNSSLLISNRTGNGWNWDTIICKDYYGNVIERMTQVFDQNNFAKTQLYEKPNGTGWENYMRNVYTRDQSGNILNMLTEAWTGTQWTSYSRVTVSYSNDLIIMELVEIYNNGWQNNKKRTYEYNGAGLKTKMVEQIWNLTWQNNLMSVFTYDGNGNMHMFVASYSDGGGPWITGGRYTYYYDVNDYYVETLIESWGNEVWTTEGKITYTNSSAGDILSETFNAWQEGSYIPDTRKVYTYDSYGNALSGVNEEYSGGSWVPRMGSSYLYYKKEYIQVINIPVYTYEASYRSVMGINDHDAERIRVYPNPASDHLTVIFQKENAPCSVSITDLQGNSLGFHNNIRDKISINTSNFTDGMYILNITSSGKTVSEKIIIKK